MHIAEKAMLAEFFSVAVLWLITGIQWHLVRFRFLRKCPEEALRYVTPPDENGFKNITFMFRKAPVALLRQYPDLWKLRKRALVLFMASVLWPIFSMIILGIFLSSL